MRFFKKNFTLWLHLAELGDGCMQKIFKDKEDDVLVDNDGEVHNLQDDSVCNEAESIGNTNVIFVLLTAVFVFLLYTSF